MSSTRGINGRYVHLAVAGAAAGLALASRRGGRWRAALGVVAAVELVNAAAWPSRRPIVQQARDDEAAAERVRDDVVRGVPMRWEEHGEGLPVVFVHGIPTHPRLWRYVIPRVQRAGVRCLAWELVGHGWSMAAGRGRDISVARQADYLEDWLDHLGIDRAIFVGHDLGGGVLQQLLTRRPGRALGLVLADCIAYRNWPVPPVLAARACRGLIRHLPPAWLRPIFLGGLMSLGHDDDARHAESAELHWRPYDRPIGPEAFAQQLGSLDSDDTAEVAPRLHRIDVPTQVVWAENDPLGLDSARRLAADLRAELRVIPGARHFTPEDHPAALAEAIDDVLAEVAASPDGAEAIQRLVGS